LVKTEINIVLKNNKGFKTLLRICSIINSEYKKEEKDANINLTPGQITPFKYAPITSCDVEIKGVLININQFYVQIAQCLYFKI